MRGATYADVNTSGSTPALSADILGDWREEVGWRTADSRAPPAPDIHLR
ncbi:rhamnogalacturonan lyase family protein [Micromonospora thermarum]